MLAPTAAARPPAPDVARQLRRPAFAAPWDPWGQPLVPEEPATVLLTGTAGDRQDRIDAPGATGRPSGTTAPSGSFRYGRAALAGLAALAAAGLVIWTVGEGSSDRKPTGPQVTTTGPTATPVPAAATRLSTLIRDVNAGVASGSVPRATGDAVTGDARQAVSAGAAGHSGARSPTSSGPCRTISAGVPAGSLTSRQGQLLRADLSALAATLGVTATSAPPSTVARAVASSGTGPSDANQPARPPREGRRKRRRGRNVTLSLPAGRVRARRVRASRPSNQQANLTNGQGPPAEQDPVVPTSHAHGRPPRRDACSPTSSAFPVRSPQKTASTQCADPVAGSSGMPAFGAKKRLTQSMPCRSPGAVTRTPRVPAAASRARSGTSDRTAAASASCTSRSKRLRPHQLAPSIPSSAGEISAATGGSAGKSISIQPSPAGVHVKSPLRVWKRAAATENVSGSQGGVPAQVDLDSWGKPAQVVIPVRPRNHEGSLRQVHFIGHGLHAIVRRKPVHQRDGRGIAREGPVRKGVDHSEMQTHGGNVPFPGRLSPVIFASHAVPAYAGPEVTAGSRCG